jgi:very-short-patch-repair endonuclease
VNKSELALWLEGIGFTPEVGGLVPGRRFRADFHHPSGIVVEYDGVMGYGASHLSLRGVMRDQEKSNLLQLNGFLVIRVNAQTCADGSAQRWVEQALQLRTQR